MNRLSFKLPGQRLFLGLFLVCLALLGAKVAYADPHAVFYTATGQEQLFFNVLAALNQADFVEPAAPQTGTPAEQSGQEILEKRTKAGFPEEPDPQVNATETQLSAVLTRNITLEGNDVWTAYIAIQKAVDTERAVVSAQLTQQYCQKGLGEKDCQNTVAAKKNQDKAFVTDPSKYANLPLVNGALSVLKSGLPEHDQALEQAMADNSGPLANDQNIADLRANNQNDPNKADFVNTLLTSGAASFVNTQVDSHLLDNFNFSSDGSVTIADNSPINEKNIGNGTYIDDYLNMVDQVSDLPYDIFNSAYSADLALQNFYNSPAVSGAGGSKGDLQTYPDANGGVSAKVTVPAGVKDELAKAPINQIAQFDSNRNYVPAAQSYNPDGNQLLTSEVSGNSNQPVANSAASGTVAGIASDQTAALMGGRVAGITTGGTPGDTNPQALPEAFQDEPAPSDYLTAIGVNDPNTGCGCSLNNAINDYGSVIIKRINQ